MSELNEMVSVASFMLAIISIVMWVVCLIKFPDKIISSLGLLGCAFAFGLNGWYAFKKN